jgi:hypothetical protein
MSSTETNYSNSEFDALIRDAPLQDFEDLAAMNYDNSPRSGSNLLPKTPLKRRQSFDKNDSVSPIPVKRRAFTDLRTGSPSLQVCIFLLGWNQRHLRLFKQNKNNTPLFLLDSPNDRNSPAKCRPFPRNLPAAKPSQDAYEEFVLDYNLFDILPAPTSSTPVPTASTSSYSSSAPPAPLDISSSSSLSSSSSSKSWNTSATSISSMFTPDPPRMVDKVVVSQQQRHKPTSPPKAFTAPSYRSEVYEEDDPLAELEAWLNSDAVILLPPK